MLETKQGHQIVTLGMILKIFYHPIQETHTIPTPEHSCEVDDSKIMPLDCARD